MTGDNTYSIEPWEEMKPCPFCGGEPEINWTGKKQLHIHCKKCYIGVVQKVLKMSLLWLRRELIKQWNTRV